MKDLKKIREKNDVSQERLAFILDCSSSLIKNYERGKPSRYLELLIKEAMDKGKLK